VGEHVRRMSKGKIIPVLNKAQRHENVQRVEVQIHTWLSWALDGSEWTATLPGRLNPSPWKKHAVSGG